MSMNEIKLRYGCNPHQKPARIYTVDKALPLTVLNGSPGYINLCDALNSWQLVSELAASLEMAAAASFKHVSPAGAAIAVPMSEAVARASFVHDLDLSPLAIAYSRARGADRMSSFGDWAALSDVVDESTAMLLKREVSDGVIAPGYEKKAFDILKQKKNGVYGIIQIDPTYQAPVMETREIFGVTFEQARNNSSAGFDLLKNIVTHNKTLSEQARRDLVIAQICLKYTQSNSVCYAFDGQVIGVGAGQQSRIHCTRLAGEKADRWFLRQHPAILGFQFAAGVSRPEQSNCIDQFLEEAFAPAQLKRWNESFQNIPQPLSRQEKHQWLDRFSGVALASDGFFPFRDNIDRAAQSGVSYVSQPGGSLRDEDVIAACDEYGMVMALTGMRLFHH